MPSRVYFQPVPDETELALLDGKVTNSDEPASQDRRNSGSKESSPKNGNSMGRFSFRLGGKGSGNKNNPKSPNRKNKAPPSSSLLKDRDSDDDDPVMAFYRARTKQRVRFSLENDGAPPPPPPPEEQAPRDGSGGNASSSIKKFMKGALFLSRGSPKSSKQASDEFEAELSREIETAKKDPDMEWENSDFSDAPEVVRSRSNPDKKNRPESSSSRSYSPSSFDEDPQTKASVSKCLNKARRAQHVHFRYRYAVKYYIKALELMTLYPDNHPTVIKAMDGLNSAHHSLNSYKNSANIVKMGIKYEDTGELVRALKMYTIAYRIRRDHLSPSHPSLVVLLNMLGSIQTKRGELEEAMQIYELALKDGPVSLGTAGSPTAATGDDADDSMEEIHPFFVSLLTRSVTFREMGTIYELWGESDTALEMYHRSLKCIAEYKGISYRSPLDSSSWDDGEEDNDDEDEDEVGEKKVNDMSREQQAIIDDLEAVRMRRSFVNRTDVVCADKGMDEGSMVDGGMEVLFGLQRKGKKAKNPSPISTSSSYDVFFPSELEEKIKKKGSRGKKTDGEDDNSDVDAALTLHQIAQMHRAKGEYNLALAAYNVSLRGMRFSLGKYHPNVAAILGNIGNLRKDMGDMDSAFETYQQVLAIESYRLGLSHPDVTVTLHNIATIDAARGNHDHALSLYKQVLALQRKLFGENDESLAVTSACMGDVYERIGDLMAASDCFEEALRIKMMTLGRNSLEVARLFHKLGKLAIAQKEFQLAHTCVSKAILVYRLNHLAEDDEWMVDANRDGADIDAAIALGPHGDSRFEC